MGGYQYIRNCKLLVYGSGGSGLDLSGLRIQFKVKKTDSETPNTAEITVYNITKDTVSRIGKEFGCVSLQAGYESNFGVIFTGNIKCVDFGKENGTDTFIKITAGDGDDAYNNAVVNATLSAGSTHGDQINKATGAMSSGNVSKGSVEGIGGNKLARGKVMYGLSRKYIRQVAASNQMIWSIQDGKMQMVKVDGLLPGQGVLLNSKTGLIGTPEKSDDGIKAKCLLNPMMRVSGLVKIDEASVAGSGCGSDGEYKLLSVEHNGDTHGQDWYSDIVCVGVNATTKKANKGKKPKSRS